MSVRSRIAIIVETQNARRAAAEVDGVARSVDNVGDQAAQSERKMRRAQATTDSWRRGVRGLATAATVGAAAIGGLGLVVGKSAVDEFRDSYKITRATASAIKESGGVANVSAKEVGDLANELSLKAGIDDEAIQSAQNLLLTFRNVRNEVGKGNDIFNQASATALDMSAAYDQSLKTSAIQLGKALQDPVAGAAALKRVGAVDQKHIDRIKKMAENHRSLGDMQRYVLNSVNKAGVRNRAEAIADPFDKAEVAVGNLAETLGWLIGPPLMDAAGAAAKFVNQIQTGKGAGGTFRRVFVGAAKDIADTVGDAYRFVKDLVDAFRDGDPAAVALAASIAAVVTGLAAFKVISTVVGLINAAKVAMIGLNVAMRANPIVLVASVIVGLGVALVIAYRKVEWFRNAVNAVWAFLKKHWPLLLPILTGPIGLAVAFIIKNWGRIKGVFWAVVGAVGSAATATVNRITAIKDGATRVVSWVVEKFEKLITFFTGLPGKIGGSLRNVFVGLWEGFKANINRIIQAWNDLEFHMGGTDLGPFGHLPEVNLSTPNIPLLAEGGDITRRGAAIVGDDGPELLELPAGARVTPLERVDGLGLGGGFTLDGDIVLHDTIEVDGTPLAKLVRRIALRDAAKVATA